MYMTEAVKKSMMAIVEWLVSSVPEDIYTTMSGTVVKFQVHSQEDVARIRRLLPGLVWKKHYDQDLGWWNYTAYSSEMGCNLQIYAVTENPPTCRIERRTIEVEEDVPVTFEKRMVQKEIVEVICGD